MKAKILLAIFVLVIMGALKATAGVPPLINYQGRLADINGLPLDNIPADPADGQVDITFSIYDTATGGNLIWQEKHLDVSVENGLFSVLLGSVVEIDPSSVFPPDVQVARYLEIEVDDGLNIETLGPRKEIVSVAYAMRAEDADTVDGKHAGEFITDETDPTVTASVKDGVDWSELSGIPADIADGDQVGITEETDPGFAEWISANPNIDLDARDDGDFRADGSVPMTGNLTLNGHYLSGDGENEGVYVDGSGNVKVTGGLDVEGDMAIVGEVTMERVVMGLLPVPTNGLILHYNFNELEEGGIVTDLSGAGNNGSVHGTFQITDGVIKGAYAFDGVTSHITIENGTAAEIPEQPNYTVSVWFLNNGGGNWTGYGQKIVDKTVMYHDFHLCVYPGGGLHFDIYEQGYGGLYDASHDYRDGTWHHAVAVVKDAKYGELWVDGELKVTGDNLRQVYSPGTMMVGYSGSPDHWQRRHWSGDIDEIRMYERALTADEARALYLMGPPAVAVNSSVTMLNNPITDLADPVNDQDAATKAYVDQNVGRWDGGSEGLDVEAGHASLELGSAAMKDAGAFAPADLSSYAGNNITYSNNQLHALPGYTDADAVNAVSTAWPKLDTDSTDDGDFKSDGSVPMSGNLHVAGSARFDQGIIYSPPMGNLSMGIYTNTPPM